MKKLYALLVVLILFAVPSCFALNTASDLYPELECVHGTMDYTIHAGATLSGIAQHYRQRMAVIANVQANGITDLDRIYAGKTMIIPCPTERAAIRSMNVRKIRKAVSSSMRDGYVYGKFVPETMPEKTIDLETTATDNSLIALEPIVTDLPLTDRPFVETPPATIVADAAPTQPEQAPLPSHSSKAKKVKGYKLVLTAAEAKNRGIVLNHDLETRVLLFNSERDKTKGLMDGERHDLRSRAVLKGNNVVLSISLKHLPNRPFIVLIQGANQPIDGDYLAINAEPFFGRFPGPRRFTRIMFAGSKMALNVGIVTLVSGGNLPLGLGVGFGTPIIRAAIRHHVNTLQNNAEFELRKTELILQPTEIASSNPND